MPDYTLLNSDVMSALKEIPDGSVNCIVTSPPYWQLRDYGDETCTDWDEDVNCEHEFGESYGLNGIKVSKATLKSDSRKHIDLVFELETPALIAEFAENADKQLFREHILKMFIHSGNSEFRKQILAIKLPEKLVS